MESKNKSERQWPVYTNTIAGIILNTNKLYSIIGTHTYILACKGGKQPHVLPITVCSASRMIGAIFTNTKVIRKKLLQNM